MNHCPLNCPQTHITRACWIDVSLWLSRYQAGESAHQLRRRAQTVRLRWVSVVMWSRSTNHWASIWIVRCACESEFSYWPVLDSCVCVCVTAGGLSVCLSLTPHSLWDAQSVCLSVSHSTLAVRRSVCLSVCLSLHTRCETLSLSVCLSLTPHSLWDAPSVCLSVSHSTLAVRRSVCLSVCLSLHTRCETLSLSVCLSLTPHSLWDAQSVCLSVSHSTLAVRRSVCLSVCLSLHTRCETLSLSVCLSVSHSTLAVRRSVCLSVCLSLTPHSLWDAQSVCLSVSHSTLAVRRSVCLSVCLSLHTRCETLSLPVCLSLTPHSLWDAQSVCLSVSHSTLAVRRSVCLSVLRSAGNTVIVLIGKCKQTHTWTSSVLLKSSHETEKSPIRSVYVSVISLTCLINHWGLFLWQVLRGISLKAPMRTTLSMWRRDGTDPRSCCWGECVSGSPSGMLSVDGYAGAA